MIPEIGGKPKQRVEEGGGGNGWGGWLIGLAMMRELRQWWVSFGGGGEEVDESVRVCGWGWWESVKLKPLWRMIVWALWELRAWEEKKEKRQKERDEILFYVMACGLQGSRKAKLGLAEKLDHMDLLFTIQIVCIAILLWSQTGPWKRKNLCLMCGGKMEVKLAHKVISNGCPNGIKGMKRFTRSWVQNF